MAPPPIRVRKLSKVFKVHEREEGLLPTLRSLFARRFTEIAAVKDVDFDLAEGEIVGFLGPNGAGKTTTLKMLSGLLFPTHGEATVLGHIPWKRDRELLQAITLVMGNRSQLIWDIPAADSMRVLQEIFQLPEDRYRRSLDNLTELLELEPLLHKPVRNLSLGERMKVEFAAALIHEPRVLFLDEPTIGLDVTMQSRIRRFVAEYNQRTGATILLTSHYMDDVVALCKRVIVIHHGQLLFDGALTGLAERMAPYKLIRVSFAADVPVAHLEQYGEPIQREDGRVTLRVDRRLAPDRTALLVRDFGEKVVDLTLEDPPIEEVIEGVFARAEVLA
ncbi:MAG: ATP-binding cassette domain-containing protein [Chloroflexi bacterium]|nr:ATP-binding cassette domain-containing protein [Chloroflexota bacterium]MBV9131066.1 ATP-binding cassette domain-containing protein [Chloroflexota bacterium]MBV9895005.1 ATP-binding cassette domain-containing protein [Chloroflexota bacterium]